jgi:hypothetical protein
MTSSLHDSLRAHLTFTLAALASLTLALAPGACSSSSGSACTYDPGPPPVTTITPPCGLGVTAVTVTGPCLRFGTLAMPQVQGNGSGGTCQVQLTLSNGAHTTVPVTFTAEACGVLEPSSPTIDLDGGACDAGATD